MTKANNDNFFAALEIGIDNGKASLAVASVPLGILLVQLRYLAALDVFWIRLLATATVASLFAATILAWLLLNIYRSWYLIETFKKNGNIPQKGRSVMTWITKDMSPGENASEDIVLVAVSRLVKPFWITCVLGYFGLIILVFGLIWVIQ